MQFSVVAVAAFAASAHAHVSATVYTTEKVTITSCAPTVTYCPARSTVTSLTSYPVVTPHANTTSAPSPSATPVCSVVYNACIQRYINDGGSPNFAVCNAEAASCTGTVSASIPPFTAATASTTAIGVPSSPASPPVISIVTISTCIPTVIISTVTLPPAAPTAPTFAPSSTGTMPYGHNATIPAATFTPKPSNTITANGASTLSGSIFVAALAGVAAFILA